MDLEAVCRSLSRICRAAAPLVLPGLSSMYAAFGLIRRLRLLMVWRALKVILRFRTLIVSMTLLQDVATRLFYGVE